MIFDSNFNIYRTDRSDRNSLHARGGGVLIAIRNKLVSSECCLPDNALESVWVKLSLLSGHIYIGNIYIPPNKSNDTLTLRHLSSTFETVNGLLKPNDLLVILGDFNQSLLKWYNQRPLSAPACGHMFIDIINLHLLRQLNTVKNQNDKTLDLVLTNVETAQKTEVRSLIAEEYLLPADNHHPPILATIDCRRQPNPETSNPRKKLNFRRANFGAINNAIFNANWEHMYSAVTIDNAVESFTTTLANILKTHVPCSKAPRNPPWANAELKSLKRRKKIALKKRNRYPSVSNEQSAKLLLRTYSTYNKLLYDAYISRTQSSLRDNPKAFWSYANARRKNPVTPSSIEYNGLVGSTEKEICEVFAARFSDVFCPRISDIAAIDRAGNGVRPDVVNLERIHVDGQSMNKALSKLKSSYIPGPDGIPSVILKKCGDALTPLLANLFERSLGEGEVPRMWKTSWMVPIHKKGDKNQAKNFRGVTSLSAVSKVLELIIHDSLLNASKHYISPQQHGFIPKRSTSTNLTRFVSDCMSYMDRGMQVDCIYTDLKAAFDSISIDILLKKLNKLGLSKTILQWLRSYLVDRTYKVKFGQCVSSPFSSSSGVPQGSNLGPLLFVLYVNDLVEVLPENCSLMYADDVKLYMPVKTLDDCRALEAAVLRFSTWCDANFLRICAEKCYVLSFTRSSSCLKFNYSIYLNVIGRTDQMRDLGILLDSKLTFKPHLEDITGRANRTLGLIFKMTKDFDDPLCIKTLYCSLVRPILEYGSVIWCPYTANWINRLEAVQRKCSRYAIGKLNWTDRTAIPPYNVRCQLLGLESLEIRRRNHKASFIAGLLLGSIDAPSLLDNLFLTVPRLTTRHHRLLHETRCNTQYAANAPMNAMIRTFNTLAEHFEFSTDISTFKNSIRSYI